MSSQEDVQGEDSKPVESSSNRKASTSSRDRPDSASRSRTDSIVTAEVRPISAWYFQSIQFFHNFFLRSIFPVTFLLRNPLTLDLGPVGCMKPGYPTCTNAMLWNPVVYPGLVKPVLSR